VRLGNKISKSANVHRRYRVSADRLAIVHFRLSDLSMNGSVVNVVAEHMRMAYDVQTMKDRFLVKEIVFNLNSRYACSEHRAQVEGLIKDLDRYATLSSSFSPLL
jgi:hypothetical protein